MADPIFWLGLSILLVAVSLTAVLVVALPALMELARAARSAEKLFDTLSRELPPTLEAIRLTGMEITDLTDDVSEGVQSAGRVVQQVDRSLGTVKKQAQQAQVGSRSVWAGVRAAWRTLNQPSASRRPSLDRLPPSARRPLDIEDNYPPRGTNRSASWDRPYSNEQDNSSYLSEPLSDLSSGLASDYPETAIGADEERSLSDPSPPTRYRQDGQSSNVEHE